MAALTGHPHEVSLEHYPNDTSPRNCFTAGVEHQGMPPQAFVQAAAQDTCYNMEGA